MRLLIETVEESWKLTFSRNSGLIDRVVGGVVLGAFFSLLALLFIFTYSKVNSVAAKKITENQAVISKRFFPGDTNTELLSVGKVKVPLTTDIPGKYSLCFDLMGIAVCGDTTKEIYDVTKKGRYSQRKLSSGNTR